MTTKQWPKQSKIKNTTDDQTKTTTKTYLPKLERKIKV